MISRIRPETNNFNVIRSFFNIRKYRKIFETSLSRYFNVHNVLLVSSARAGLYFLFCNLPQKKVFLPAYTCWVVIEAAKLAHKEVIFVDIKYADFNMDPDKLNKVITPGAIIVATHQFGIPCDIETILKIAKKHNCFVIEDNAAAIGSEYKIKKTGSFAPVAVISFELSKSLTSSKGGAILFKDQKLFYKISDYMLKEIQEPSFIESAKELVHIFTYNMMTQKSIFPIIHYLFSIIKGSTMHKEAYESLPDESYYNNLANNLITLGFFNWKQYSMVVKKRKFIARYYFEKLQNLKNIILPKYPNYKEPVFMRFPVRVKNIKKEIFYQRCVVKGVDLAFTFSYTCSPKGECPVADLAAKEVINLPIYSQLTNGDLKKIVDVIYSLDQSK